LEKVTLGKGDLGHTGVKKGPVTFWGGGGAHGGKKGASYFLGRWRVQQRGWHSRPLLEEFWVVQREEF